MNDDAITLFHEIKKLSKLTNNSIELWSLYQMMRHHHSWGIKKTKKHLKELFDWGKIAWSGNWRIKIKEVEFV